MELKFEIVDKNLILWKISRTVVAIEAANKMKEDSEKGNSTLREQSTLYDVT